jgi:signal transduction histidine kinase
MTALADEAIRAVRRVATDLRPGVLDDLGLPAALEWQAHEFSRRSVVQLNRRGAAQQRARVVV